MPYKCTAGKTTIGVGRNIEDIGISKEESAYLLDNDLRRVEAELFRTFPWATNLDPVRHAVLMDMLFNLGLSRFIRFRKFLAAMERRDWPLAALEMEDSAWYRQVKSRARRLQAMVFTGAWPGR
jgi:lysozyme